MAGKLTPEQKALNKEATKLRDRAYNTRKNAWRAEMDNARATVENGPEGKAWKAANEALEKALSVREAELAAIQAQIDTLQRKLAEVQAEQDALVEPCREARERAWKVSHQAQKAAEEEVESRYTDVARCWSAAGWKSFEEFLPLVGKSKP